MATIQSLIERIETRLFLVSGLDVQIHAEGQLEEMLRHRYNVLFDDFWDPDYTLFMSVTLDGVTGEHTTDLTNIVRRFKDIHTLYWDEDEDPLPRVTPGSQLTRIRTRSVMPSGNPSTVFKVIPTDTTGPVHFWYRTRISDAVWENQQYQTEINMDDELLMLGTIAEFLANDESNMTAFQQYQQAFAQRLQQMREAQWQVPISKRKLERDGPLTRWE